MRLLYKPLGIIATIIGRKAGRRAFDELWAEVGDGEIPPRPIAGYRRLGSVFFTAALEAAVLAGVGAVFQQLGGRVFHHLIGIWPTEPLPKPGDSAQ